MQSFEAEIESWFLLSWPRLACVTLLVLVLGFWVKHLVRNSAWYVRLWLKAPPLVSGPLPFVGCAVRFAAGPPVKFIPRCQRRLGDVFTLHLAGRRLTFLLNPRHFPLFFQSPEHQVDFVHATQPFLTRGFGVPRQEYFDYHVRTLTTLRRALSPHALSEHNRRLVPLFQRYLSERIEPAEVNLHTTVRRIIFDCSVTLLLGEGLAAHQALMENFSQFDALFEVASSPLPHLFLPQFRRAKAHLLSALRECAAELKGRSEELACSNGGVGASLIDAVDRPGNEASWLLSILWAAEANTIPMTVWLIMCLLHHPEYLALVREEIATHMYPQRSVDQKQESEQESSKECVFHVPSAKTFEQMTHLRNAVFETVRLYSATIILRQACQPVPVDDYVVPAGNYLCLSPLWTQRSPELFEDPDEWKPSRWSDPNALHKNHRYAFLAFGSGKYRCPGQYFALLEMTSLVALILTNFDIESLETSIPGRTFMHSRFCSGGWFCCVYWLTFLSAPCRA